MVTILSMHQNCNRLENKESQNLTMMQKPNMNGEDDSRDEEQQPRIGSDQFWNSGLVALDQHHHQQQQQPSEANLVASPMEGYIQPNYRPHSNSPFEWQPASGQAPFQMPAQVTGQIPGQVPALSPVQMPFQSAPMQLPVQAQATHDGWGTPRVQDTSAVRAFESARVPSLPNSGMLTFPQFNPDGKVDTSTDSDALPLPSSAYGRNKKPKTNVLPADFTPTQWTVQLGRGRCSESVGNRRMRLVVKNHLKEYSEAKEKLQKSFVVSRVMKIIREASPVGAFVKFEKGRWYEVDERAAREKVSLFAVVHFALLLATKSSAYLLIFLRLPRYSSTLGRRCLPRCFA